MHLSVSDCVAELFGLPTKEMYDELLEDYFKYKTMYEELKRRTDKSNDDPQEVKHG